MGHKNVLLRTWMFVPGNRQRMLEKAMGVPVGAVMMDIEDGVAPAEKDLARQQIAISLDQVAVRLKNEKQFRTPARFVRINAVGHERCKDDLASIVRQGLEGLVLPKVETPEQVRTVEQLLDRRESEVGLARGSVRLLPALESPKGLFNAYAIASASPRVIGLLFGAEDFSRELGLPLRREGEARDLIFARSALVTAAACAHVQAVDGVWPDLQDTEGLKTFALQSRRLGFSGMSVIHPAQVETVNAAFSPTADDVDYARRVLQAFDEANARGEGAVAFGGQLLDLPIIDRARQTLDLAESLVVRSL
ncbi:MAG TPA: CoA ester lyase [Candidatus Dormibacteraeota bacterium]|nr:CoA ester lyase [Candidatus Dormibacteraeota bacterium]